MLPFVYLFAAALIALVYYVIDYYRFVARYPRGPPPIPLFGNLFQLHALKIHDEIPELVRQYGGVFTIFVPMPFVIIADYDALKEAFVDNGEDYVGRPAPPRMEFMDWCENGGVINSNGDSWRENRRTSISILRDFGMGKGLMEEKVKLSIEEFLQYLESIPNKESADLRWPIQLMVSNVINETLFGFRYKYDDCEPLMNYVSTFASLSAQGSQSVSRFALYKYAWIMKIMFNYIVPKKIIHQLIALKTFIDVNVDRALETYSQDSEPECFVHAYTQRIPSNPHLNDDQLRTISAEFFIAGQESTTTTLRFAVLYLAAQQEIQENFRSEILRVVGTSRLPSMADKKAMPYAAATVMEIQRIANVLQQNVPRVTTVDTVVQGFSIPEGTFVDGDIHTIMAHSAVFERPTEFRPERYLEEDGTTFRKELIEQTTPFSIGKRQCAGEALARVELFLGLTSMVQHYKFLPCEGAEIDLEPKPGIIMLPKEQNIRLERVTA